MGVGDQVRSFVAWLIDDQGGGPVRLADKRVVMNYRRWAEMWNVVPIPSSLLLAGLKKHPQVAHKRDRLLDARGRAMRNANGTPLRGSFYTFAATQPKAQPRLPGKVPVTDMVPHAPLLARPRPAAPPVQRAQPERIAA